LVDELNELADDGPFAAVLAIEALGAIDHGAAFESLTALLSAPEPLIRRHAAWRLRRRSVAVAAVPRLLDMLIVGGIDTMHSHRTLRRWAASDPAIAGSAIARLSTTGDGRQRARLIDLLGAIDDPRTTEVLVNLASDVAEFGSARIAAIGGMADRCGADEAALRRLAACDDEVGAHATLAVCDRASATAVAGRTSGGGLRIAQLTMAAGLDGQLSLGGRGDTGGVASLLVSLGEALASRPEIDHVLTIGRGTVTDAILGSASIPLGEAPVSFATIAIGDHDRPAETTDDLWEHLPSIERGLRRTIRRAGGIDLLHLRMADAGTLAGAQIAAAEGIPTCFSLAPDPHNVLSSLRARGEADRAAVVRLATEGHIWFRARLVERLARESDRIALFPRSKPIDFFTGPGAASDRSEQRCAVVAEGIDIGLIRRAEAADEATTSSGGSCDDVLAGVLADLASGMSKDRCHLPLLVSVGRLNPVKGMDRVVAAWAADPLLHERLNLVIVGGDLDDPSATERSVLEQIDRLVPAGDARRTGLHLLGGRPHADVARLLVSAAHGLAGYWAAGGVYVDGAWKEEFGLAVIEALAAGLVVVAPSVGGPPTYIDDGDIGVLVDPNADLGDAISRAVELVDRPGRAGRARRLIEQRYSVETMAERLAGLYRPLAVVR
jgi:glycosyltransferase involved in cell wall biosynthesis